MAEQHWRCRFWPRCAIHSGEPRPRHFSSANHAEMRAMRLLGATVSDIARVFEGDRRHIGLILYRKEAT